ncbi:DUF6907 domain-containing protein [Solicola gregarius]|uniref:Uncharacterized protein n=1 Tax=Solicola gregarius TaxID=2908642 RepID=A0AA46YKN8_9ACTN|nr:hypothetical protein [Solicola gregarius]UYM04784.1 hypothetical protein L0C25_19940 [Solicola gregarius]
MSERPTGPDDTPCPAFCTRQETPEHSWAAVDAGWVREHLAATWPAVPRDGTGAVRVEAGASEFDDGTILPAVWISLEDRSGELTADEARRLADHLQEAATVADRLAP